ncbi:MAG: TIGR03009 domain-containing protein [Pirellulaceae bacterium]|nr:TIGR03009 domain-containing protein [Pirellulaceae bacterium]
MGYRYLPLFVSVLTLFSGTNGLAQSNAPGARQARARQAGARQAGVGTTNQRQTASPAASRSPQSSGQYNRSPQLRSAAVDSQSAAAPSSRTSSTQVPNRRASGPPAEFQLTPADQQRLDMILNYWEKKTDGIKTFQCKFTRENWDFVFGPKDAPRSIDRGTIRFAKPDKGLMRVDEVYSFDPEATDKKNRFKKQETQFGEYWVCDGKAIFQFDSRTKVLTETQLPPEMRGKAIAEGPLPFLFGAKASTMKQRYWIRELRPPAEVKDKFWLEAVPKRADDAANFAKIQVILAKPKSNGSQLLPENIKVFNKQGYLMYRFSDHHPNNATHRVAGFFRSFVSPKTPRGWTKVIEKWNDPQIANQPPTNAPSATEPRLGTKLNSTPR